MGKKIALCPIRDSVFRVVIYIEVCLLLKLMVIVSTWRLYCRAEAIELATLSREDGRC